jgi:hypothetical protein
MEYPNDMTNIRYSFNNIPTNVPKEGNRYELQELEQKLSDGLTKRKIKDTSMLSLEIEKVSINMKRRENGKM